MTDHPRPNVSTWADGFGNWHASVETDGAAGSEKLAKRVALKAVRSELAQREGSNFAPEVVGVALARRVSRDGTLTYYYDETNTNELVKHP